MKRLNPNTNSFFKRGEIDSNGNSFWCYQKNIIENGYFRELWISKEKIVLYEENLINGYKKYVLRAIENLLLRTIFTRNLVQKTNLIHGAKSVF